MARRASLALSYALALGIVPSASAAKSQDKVERQRLAHIRQVARKGTAAENWYFLVVCARPGTLASTFSPSVVGER